MTLTDLDWAAATALVNAAEQVVLACHVGPDGDALGSMLGFGVALRDRGTPVVASFGSEPFEVPRVYACMPGQDLLVHPAALPEAPALLITFDTGSADRLGSLARLVDSAAAVLVVDHHASGAPYGTHRLVDPAAAATAVLVAELVDRLGLPLTADVAAPLYTGLVTDTGSFKYAATSPEVHALAGRLLATGIRHDLISRAIWDTQPFGYVQLLGAVASRATLDPAAVGGLGLVWTSVTAADLSVHGLGLADVEGVIDVIRTAQEAEVALVVKQEPEGSVWRISTRSKGRIDVGAVCAGLGGGGHRYAAGFTAYDGVEAAVRLLTDRLSVAPHLPA